MPTLSDNQKSAWRTLAVKYLQLGHTACQFVRETKVGLVEILRRIFGVGKPQTNVSEFQSWPDTGYLELEYRSPS
jgi:hypothetical protein